MFEPSRRSALFRRSERPALSAVEGISCNQSPSGDPQRPTLPHPRPKPWSLVTDSPRPNVDNSLANPDALTRTVQDFLSEAASAVVL